MKKLLSLLLLTALLLLGGCAKKPLPSTADKPVRLVFATDLHYLSQSLTDNGEGFVTRMRNGDGKMVPYIEPITDAFIAGLLADPPDALILGGDLTLDGERQSHRDLSAKLKPLGEAGIPVLALSGNHDTGNYMASGFAGNERETVETIETKEFRKLYGRLGSDDALSKDADSLSYVYPLRSDLWVLLLDVNDGARFGGLSDNTWAWLTGQLEAAQRQGVTVIAASHQNVLQHNPRFAEGYVVKENERLAALYAQYGVPLNLSGHIHMQHISQGGGGFYEAVSSSLAVNPCQYANITFDGDTLDYSTKAVDVSGWAKSVGSTDPALLDFAVTARQFFWDTAHESNLGYFSQWDMDQAHVDQMAEFYADLNTDYFAGAASTRTAQDPAYALWERYEQEGFFLGYIGSMLESTRQEQTSLTIAVK